MRADAPAFQSAAHTTASRDQTRSIENRAYFSAAFFGCLSGCGLKGLEVFSEPGGRYSTRPDGSEIARVEYVARGHVALSN